MIPCGDNVPRRKPGRLQGKKQATVPSSTLEIKVDEESFLALREIAQKEQKPVRQLASEILKQRRRTGGLHRKCT
jgi:hypothetical protein